MRRSIIRVTVPSSQKKEPLWNFKALVIAGWFASASTLPPPIPIWPATAASAVRRQAVAVMRSTLVETHPHKVEGEENLTIYQARIRDPDNPEHEEVSSARRHFCRRCGSALWVYDPRWPELIHPFASAIDTPLPKPPEKVRIMLDFAAPWCEIPKDDDSERHFPRYPDESIEDWHRRHGL